MSQHVSSASDTQPLSEQPLICEQWINAPREAVWGHLTDKDKLARWFGNFAEVPTLGNEYRISIGENVACGTFLELDPPARVVFTWGWVDFDTVPPGSTSVTIELAEQKNGTLVTLTHEGLPLGPEDEHATGWAGCLTRLEAEFGVGE